MPRNIYSFLCIHKTENHFSFSPFNNRCICKNKLTNSSLKSDGNVSLQNSRGLRTLDIGETLLENVNHTEGSITQKRL